MTTTVTIENSNIIINSLSLETILEKVYQKGKSDALLKDDKVSFIQLSKELLEKGKKLTPRTLSNRAIASNIKIIPVDGKRNGVYRSDVKHFVTL